MRSPLHYWLLYLAGLLAATAALGWLSREALLLDQAEARSRQQAELEDDVGRALWRMDARIMPLIAKEAARPYFQYEPFYPPPAPENGKPSPPLVPSPLLTQRSEFVLLNFQLSPGNEIKSAQLPQRNQWQQAIACGVRSEDLVQCESRLDSLRSGLDFDALVVQLPEDSIQESAIVLGESSGDQSSQRIVANSISLSQSPWNSASPVDSAPLLPEADEAYGLKRSQSLNTKDLANRDVNFQKLAQQQYVQQREDLAGGLPNVREGISQPVWVGDRLLLARRVSISGRSVVQGCWLDWPKIKQALLSEVAELLPSVDLQPVRDSAEANVHRLLATLPVQLIVPEAVVSTPPWTPMRISLAVAWACLGLAAVASALLLRGVLGLSERRAAFVSAVTHELRTPLTTFQLYTDMLAQEMLPDPRKRSEYLQTLRAEADRLGHLVENVLSYARLERGRRSRPSEQVTVGQLVERCSQRFAERAAQARMEFVREVEPSAAPQILATDPGAVEQILFNLVDNACKYAARAADQRIHLRVTRDKDRIRFAVVDHGPGIAPDVRGRLFRPFCKSSQEAANSAPGVGLGLALSLRLARELGGRLEWDRQSSGGTMFVLTLHGGGPS
jgi:signal transduction histidine kinase